MASCDGDVTQWSWERSGKQRCSPAARFLPIHRRYLNMEPLRTVAPCSVAVSEFGLFVPHI